MQPDRAYLLDILDAARHALEFVSEMEFDTFYASYLHQSAVIRQLEIIGEATKRISKAFRSAHPGIPWRKMAGMRDIMIHEYESVDAEQVWKVLREDLPPLIARLEAIIPPAELD